VGKKDEKSRLDFFQLMANLTTAGKISEGAKMKIVYVQGHGNKHLLESFAPSHWNFVANSKFGRAVAKALRLKFNVKDEEFRILMLGPDGKVGDMRRSDEVWCHTDRSITTNLPSVIISVQLLFSTQ
jgi:hypothetical protein